MPSVISGDANVSAAEFGFLDGVTSALQSQIDSKLPLAGGKILQIVRATDSTNRTTTSSSTTDVTGMSVTITPQRSDSAILLIATFAFTVESSGDNVQAVFRLTDSSNNTVSGAQGYQTGTFNITGTGTRVIRWGQKQIFGYATPATTSAVTYKLRFQIDGATSVTVVNGNQTGQMYAIEVSA